VEGRRERVDEELKDEGGRRGREGWRGEGRRESVYEELKDEGRAWQLVAGFE